MCISMYQAHHSYKQHHPCKCKWLRGCLKLLAAQSHQGCGVERRPHHPPLADHITLLHFWGMHPNACENLTGDRKLVLATLQMASWLPAGFLLHSVAKIALSSQPPQILSSQYTDT